MTHAAKLKEEFVQAVAAYLISEMASKSIFLEMQKPDAKAWARACHAAGFRGWPTQEEAEEGIRRVLGL